MTGWEGNSTYWRAEDGTLVGEITPETVIKSNTFIIQRGRPKDFDLKLDFRITAGGNSGINYRSAQVPDPITPANKFAMKGYQFDIDAGRKYSGNNYEEKGRSSSRFAARSPVSSAAAFRSSSRPSPTAPSSPNRSPTTGTRSTSWSAATPSPTSSTAT